VIASITKSGRKGRARESMGRGRREFINKRRTRESISGRRRKFIGRKRRESISGGRREHESRREFAQLYTLFRTTLNTSRAPASDTSTQLVSISLIISLPT
jgi:hypothetical protein